MATAEMRQFPGFGLPVSHFGQNDFPLAVAIENSDQAWASIGVTLREQRMLDFICQITDKPDWHIKVFDDEIVSRWRAESNRPVNDDVYLSEKMFDFCIAELRDKSEHFKKTGRVNVLDAQLTVVKSDSAISKELQEELRAGVKVLEDVPEKEKDWHPGSDEKVLDLVHPSLFPVVWGLTRALERGTVPLDGCTKYTGMGSVVGTEHPSASSTEPGIQFGGHQSLWGSFQWLPSQVELTPEGAAKITSYINNLHPERHKDLYGILERIVSATIPLWEDSLGGFVDRRRIELDDTGSDDYTFPEGLLYQIPGRQPGDPKSMYNPLTNSYEPENEDVDNSDEDWRWEDDFYDWKRSNQILVQREPRDYTNQDELFKERDNKIKFIAADANKPLKLREKFPDGIQVIFKLANIHLTPEKPTYEGGSWHVEGTLNETICASAIYYFDQENITDSHLAFRQALNTWDIGMIPEQSEYYSLEAYLGVQQEGVAIQDLGQVLTREGRLLVFPNCLQHQVQPFELQDKTRPGHRKILAMFLISPQRPLLSSAHVPPQRRDWWAEELHKDGAIPKLPGELFNLTMGMVDDFPISWEKAVEIREKLMEERRAYNDNLDNFYNEQTFSFCEH